MAEKPKKTDKPAAPGKTGGAKLDLATVGGLVLAVGGILGGMTLEGGSIKEILQPTAAIIVFGGTLGAVMITTPLSVLLRAMRSVVSVFMEKQQAPQAVIEEIIGLAMRAPSSMNTQPWNFYVITGAPLKATSP